MKEKIQHFPLQNRPPAAPPKYHRRRQSPQDCRVSKQLHSNAVLQHFPLVCVFFEMLFFRVCLGISACCWRQGYTLQQQGAALLSRRKIWGTPGCVHCFCHYRTPWLSPALQQTLSTMCCSTRLRANGPALWCHFCQSPTPGLHLAPAIRACKGARPVFTWTAAWALAVFACPVAVRSPCGTTLCHTPFRHIRRRSGRR